MALGVALDLGSLARENRHLVEERMDWYAAKTPLGSRLQAGWGAELPRTGRTRSLEELASVPALLDLRYHVSHQFVPMLSYDETHISAHARAYVRVS